MANWHGYFAIEDLNLNAGQRQTLIAELRTLGPASDPQPARLCHWRTRLDNRAVIFEALFNEDNLTVERFKQRLGTIFGISWVTIGSDIQVYSFADGNTPVVTFSRNGTDYIRVGLFGGVAADWQQSRREVLGYLAANREDWEPAAVG